MKAAARVATAVTASRATASRRKKTAHPATAGKLAEFSRLECEVVNGVDRERERIGRDLHDSLGQDLTGIALMLKCVLVKLERENSQARHDVEHLIALVDNALGITHELARGLLPVGAEPGALAAALRLLAVRAGTHLQIDIEFINRCKSKLRLDVAAATHLYRIVQESLTNAARHGRATRATVRLETMKGELSLTIEDNGCGFLQTASGVSQGFGLTIMRHRARIVGAEILFETLPGGSARVLCKCPLTAGAHLLLTS